ncbi:pyridoxine 5'-phosphate oxidase [Halobacteriovorax marinus SJ]|uniref:Pyridoxamine 5'-phosphate oxidase n=1 Tax=Halobacteriovorax marinus (strain ATCC BAA-682 / DSM 15412 / SJ) TaxID=862908 RepID=E1X618_HALMS|nr:pyridoxamine 5'-phosphate oxidase [Halobacteriovorax marinus]CBW27362.1 pyridoxine 5'-phosphate oxidase [Halobacteriovorax marinus SJ]
MENLSKFDISNDPIETFENWFNKAKELDTYADAFSLATSDSKGDVSVRYLLFKGIVDGGFSFYTNYNSPKAEQLEENPRASMAFFWKNFARQVRVKGNVSRTTLEQSKKYFEGRARESQIASYISDQSKRIESREELLKLHSEKVSELEGKDIPYPSNWGGYVIDPTEIEFFIYGEFRLNDRILFKRNSNNAWDIERLQP